MVVVYRSNFMLHFHYCLDLFSFLQYPIAYDELLRKYCSRFPVCRSASNGSRLRLRHIVTLHNCVQISILKLLGSINHRCRADLLLALQNPPSWGVRLGGKEVNKEGRAQGTGEPQGPRLCSPITPRWRHHKDVPLSSSK